LLPLAASEIEFAATHEEIASGIGADKTAFMIHQLGAADRAKLPPIFLFLLGRGARSPGCLVFLH
jgi:hypothetical protein